MDNADAVLKNENEKQAVSCIIQFSNIMYYDVLCVTQVHNCIQ